MRSYSSTLTFLLLILVVPLGCSTNQSDEWEKLNQESLTLLDQGKYDRGVSVAQAAVQLAEKRFGPTSSETATSLNSLAALYRAQGKCAEMEPLYKRVLAIREKALGPDHPSVANDLKELPSVFLTLPAYGAKSTHSLDTR